MKRAYSPKEIAAKKWVTLPWDEKWSKPFGFPAENASWFISGASASGKSSFVMQLGKELCNYGTVLYMSYEEKINQSFQRRMGSATSSALKPGLICTNTAFTKELVL